MKQLISSLTLTLLLATSASAQTAPSVDLLWTANTYKPPFYQGHTAATNQSEIRATAIVSGVTNPSTLNYRWTKGEQYLAKSSGVGKDTVTISAGQAGERNVLGVEVSNSDGSLKLNKQVEIAATNPSLSFYQDQPLTGINYHQAVRGEINLAAPEIRLLAEPYFFPAADVSGQQLGYQWQLNGQAVVPDSSDNRFIGFTAPANLSGASAISLNVKSFNNIFQEATREFKINFGVSNFNF